VTATDFNELAGRTEALTRVVMHVIALLEDGGVIDGPALRDQLRTTVLSGGPAMDVANDRLHGLAAAMGAACARRQGWAGRPETPPRRT